MGGRFLAIGECMVELAPQDDGRFALGFAGDSFNTAWYVRRELPSDWSVAYLTAVGTDEMSGRMVRFMAAEGIDTGPVARLDGKTVGLYLISLTEGERSFSYWRGQSAARHLADDPARLEQALAGVTLAYLSGITLAILAPAERKTLLAALARAKERGTEVAFDPNLRPRLWSGQTEMMISIMQAAALADIVLPSYQDEASAFGDRTPEETAKRYLTAGAGLVVVKNGPGEILLAENQFRLRVQPATVRQVVDTTAAGDSFNAGFLAALLTGSGKEEALHRGARLAARVIAARGALVGD